ncbi:MAG: metallophosphoesterase [Candidatus Omnitrophota bacterium]|nr:metallophosphoesterase [Candidatus Omnitrophota bacterium]
MSKKPTKILALILSFLLIFEQSGFAQIAGSTTLTTGAQLDISAHLTALRQSLTPDKFRPLRLRYLSYNPSDNKFYLLLDKGDFRPSSLRAPMDNSVSLRGPKGRSNLNQIASSPESAPRNDIEQETKQLLNYFFIGISLPNDAFWVNLRPDSPENIIDPLLAETDIGKVFLEADLQLKKDTASYTNPQTLEGKQYWDKLYKKAEELFGYENITIPTLTRPWIVPGEIIVRESAENAYIYKATLKVMLEEDYLQGTGGRVQGASSGVIASPEGAKQSLSSIYNFSDPRLKVLNEYSSQLIRELIIPKITKEVNTAKRYAPLRQVYYSLIFAQWFKQKFYGKSGLYAWLIDRKNLNGLTSQEPYAVDSYFQAYQKSFQDGEYKIEEPRYTPYGQTIRSYFSGGIAVGDAFTNADVKLSPLGTRAGLPEALRRSSHLTEGEAEGGNNVDDLSVHRVSLRANLSGGSAIPISEAQTQGRSIIRGASFTSYLLATAAALFGSGAIASAAEWGAQFAQQDSSGWGTVIAYAVGGLAILLLILSRRGAPGPQSPPPAAAPAVFTSVVYKENMPDDFESFLFPAGTGFNSAQNWMSGIAREEGPHTGIDLAFYETNIGQHKPIPSGTPVRAVCASKVGWGRTGADGIFLETPYGVIFYNHVVSNVATGEHIEAGQVVGYVADSAHPHLHLEVRSGRRAEFSSQADPGSERYKNEFLRSLNGMFAVDPLSTLAQAQSVPPAAAPGQGSALPLTQDPLPKAEALRQMDEFLAKTDKGMAARGGYQQGGVVDLTSLPADTEVIIVGDLHGRLDNLQKILQANGNLAKIQQGRAVLVILGDAVHPDFTAQQAKEMSEMEQAYRAAKQERKEGEAHDILLDLSSFIYQALLNTESSIGLMQYLMDLKIRSPRNVYWILGDHEFFNPDLAKGYLPECGYIFQGTEFEQALQKRYGEEYLRRYSTFLQRGALAMVCNGAVAVHGGPARNTDLTALKGLAATPGYTDSLNKQMTLGRFSEDYGIADVLVFLDNMGQPKGVLIAGHTHPLGRQWHTREADQLHIINAVREEIGYAFVRRGKVEFVEIDRVVPAVQPVPAAAAPIASAQGPGGIDLRAMPIVTQPVPAGKTPDAGVGLLPSIQRTEQPLPAPASRAGWGRQGAPSTDLPSEWQEIQRMIGAGIIPSNQRIKEYLLSICDKDDCLPEIDQVLSCLADILRLEEERCSDTDAPLKEILVLLESNQPAAELQLALAKIKIEEKEPQTIEQ